jgi:hypothetical protein
MTTLDQLIPTPRLLEVDDIDVAAPPEKTWELVRHGELARSWLIKALFALRTLPGRLTGQPAEAPSLRIDNLVSSAERPGFAVLVDDPPREVAVAAIGKVWEAEIPYVHTESPQEFAAFAEPDFAKVAWALRVVPLGERDSRIEIEVRVDTTDEQAWHKFQRYFRIIGIGSRFIRHSALSALAAQLGTPQAQENERPLPGDELLSDANGQDTRGITIAAPPAAIWPWLLQLGCGRGGFYSIDLVDNGGTRSLREVHPELTTLAVGDIIPATPKGEDGFEVLRLAPERCLVLGGLYDVDHHRQLPFAAARPGRFWHVTWSFVLEPLDAGTTRLHVRARAAFPALEGLHAAWIRQAHHLMESAQLRHLAARVEGRLPRDDWRDVLSGVGGAAIMATAFLSSLLRPLRSHWGLPAEVAARDYPGDELVATPRWSWTHGIEIAAPAAAVWPWIAQLGADRGGFYSYQWLENIAGCELRNAERIHPEWQLREGGMLRLHPKMPGLRIVQLVPERYLVAFAEPDAQLQAAGKPWAAVTWLFFLEPRGPHSCRLISRYRCATSDDLGSRLTLGPTLVEPIGFAMDRRMLLGIKERAERVAPPLRRFDAAALD